MAERVVVHFSSKVSEALRVASPQLRHFVYRDRCGHGIDRIVGISCTNNSGGHLLTVEQFCDDDSIVQRYLDASKWWWLQREYPDTIPRAALVARSYCGSLVSVPWLTVVQVDIRPVMGSNVPAHPFDIASLEPYLSVLEELNVSTGWSKQRTLRQVLHVEHLLRCTQLRTLKMWYCDVESLDFLPAPSPLETLDLMCCRRLADVTRLLSTDAWVLTRVNLMECAVADFAPLRHCTRLRELQLSYASRLTNFDALAGMTSLVTIGACETALCDVSALVTCASLRELDVSGCEELVSLAPLANAPSLRRVVASYTAVSCIDGLGTSLSLEEVDLQGCPVDAEEAQRLHDSLQMRTHAP